MEGEAMALELLRVVRFGRASEFKKLSAKIAKGKDPNLLLTTTTSDSDKNTILHEAVKSWNQDTVRAILENHSLWSLLKEKNGRGNTPLHMAVASGYSDMVRSLLKHCPKADQENGASCLPKDLLSVENERGNTPLHEAARDGQILVIEVLLAALGPTLLLEALNKVNNDGETPVGLGVLSRSSLVVGAMLKAKPDIDFNLRGPHSHTLLHLTVLTRDLDSMQVILETRPELAEAGDIKGRTPLHYAAALGLNRLVDNLLYHDLSTVCTADSNQSLPIHLAAEHNDHIYVVSKLFKSSIYDSALRADGKGRNVLHIAAQNGKTKIVSYLLGLYEIKGLLNSADEDGNTPLHLAAKNSHIQIVNMFSKDLRVDACATNKDGQNVVDIMSNVAHQTTSSSGQSHTPLQEKDPEEAEGASILRFRVISKTENLDEILKVNLEPCPRGIDQKQKDLAIVVMLVATLVTTVTFAVVFQIPGGYVSSDGGDPNKGMAVLSTTSKNYDFVVFVGLDVLAMVSSLCATFCLLGTYWLDDYTTFNKVVREAMLLTWIGLLFMAGAFAAGMFTVLRKDKYLAIVTLMFVVIASGSYWFITFVPAGFLVDNVLDLLQDMGLHKRIVYWASRSRKSHDSSTRTFISGLGRNV